MMMKLKLEWKSRKIMMTMIMTTNDGNELLNDTSKFRILIKI